MNPLVRDMVKWWAKAGNDPTELQWFDLSGAINLDLNVGNCILKGRSPFDRCMVLGKIKDGFEFALVVIGESVETGIVVGGSKIYFDHHAVIPSIMFMLDNNGQLCRGPSDTNDKPTAQDMDIVSHLLASFLEAVSQQSTAYKAIPHKANVSRAKRGLSPLYDFVTVCIEPVKPRSEDRGGTHASPRQHDRRGHFRRTKTGTVWVRHCTVGDPSRGAVFHDYKFKEKNV